MLIGAFSCNPGEGSEEGAGWSWSAAAAVHHEVWLATQARYEPVIEKALARTGLAGRLHPVYLPEVISRFEGRPPLEHQRLRYAAWQRSLVHHARRLHDEIGFDVIHHLTWSGDWFPCGLSRVAGRGPHDPAFVWGPVGGASRPQWRIAGLVGARAFAEEATRAVVTGAGRAAFGARHARRADLVIAQNHDVAARFNRYGWKLMIEPNIGVDLDEIVAAKAAAPDSSGGPVAVFAGRLLIWKGVALAVAALARPEAARWRLHIYGSGPQETALRRQARELGLEDRVTFFGRRPRPEVLAAVGAADVFVFPSMHDSAGWVVAEAMAAGAPVLCLDEAGPRTLVGHADGVRVPARGDVVGALAAGFDQAARCRPNAMRWSFDRLPAIVDAAYARAVFARRGRLGPDATRSDGLALQDAS
ncbi:MAG: glycosyltransferase [Acidimicrobiales bacterium]